MTVMGMLISYLEGPFSKRTIFKCFQWKYQSHIYNITAFVQCFWNFPQIGVASIRNLMSSFGKAYDPFCTEMLWANFIYFQTFFKENQNLEPGFQNFQIPGPKYVFWGMGTFWGVQKSSIYLPCCEFYISLLWPVIKVDRIYVINNMALALFQKQL